MKIRISTIHLRGQGYITCRRCSRQTKMPGNTWIILTDMQDTLSGTVFMQEVSTGMAVHRCGWGRKWVCSECRQDACTCGARLILGPLEPLSFADELDRVP